MSKTILVTGATGKQGGAVIQALLRQQSSFAVDGLTILAVTRDTGSASARKLAAKAPSLIKLVQGNLDDPEALFAAAQRVVAHPEHSSHDSSPPSIWGVFSVQVSLGRGVTEESEAAQGEALIDKAVAVGVSHFVYSSVERGGDAASWDNPTPVPHFRSKYRVERYLRARTAPGTPGARMGWTVLRPVAFMDNLVPGFASRVFMAALRNWLGEEERPNQWVAVSDVGVFAAKAFVDPKTWDHRAVGLAGDELTFGGLSRAFRNATGDPVPEAHWLFGSLLTYLVAELRLMIGWFASDGYKADIAARRKEHPGLLTLEEWLEKESLFSAKMAKGGS